MTIQGRLYAPKKHDIIYYDQMEEVEFERELREHHFVQFWKMILKSGHITDIFMTPRWEISRGAKVEYITAKKLKIKIHFVKEI